MESGRLRWNPLNFRGKGSTAGFVTLWIFGSYRGGFYAPLFNGIVEADVEHVFKKVRSAKSLHVKELRGVYEPPGVNPPGGGV